jgi:hypothetical protein
MDWIGVLRAIGNIFGETFAALDEQGQSTSREEPLYSLIRA